MAVSEAALDPAAAVARPLAARLRIEAVAAGLLAAWLAYLYAWVPALSRGDFFLAMMRLARSVEQGNLLYALSWPLHILGGHIVFYTRVLQLANYYLFGFSPLFVKGAAMAAWALLGLGAFLFVRRLPLSPPRRLACLLLLALLTFNPIPWLVIVWADATVPYLSALIALLFVAPTLVAGVEAGWRAAPRPRMALGCVLVIIGSGVGWAILPALGWLAALRLARVGRARRFMLLAAPAAVVATALAWLLLAHFSPSLRLGLVGASLASLPSHPEQAAAYFVSLFATFFGWSRRPWNLVLGAAFLVASLLTYAAHRRREGRASEAELLYVFGLLAMLLVTLGRWKLSADRGEPNPPTYYHLFALPAYYGFIAMALRLLPARRLSRVETGGVALLVLAFLLSMPQYQRKLRELRADFVQMIRPLQGWRMTEATRLIGEPEINQELFFEFLPMLKRGGRWPELSGPFHPYKSSRMAPPQPSAGGSACGSYRNLQLLLTEPDQRRVYGTALNRPDYRRFVGVARNPARCDETGIAVALVAADGTVLCKTWTTPNVHWYYGAPEHRAVTAAGYGFDFTCPVESGAYYLVSQRTDGRVLESVRVLP
jgi:hypothetical protein